MQFNAERSAAIFFLVFNMHIHNDVVTICFNIEQQHIICCVLSLIRNHVHRALLFIRLCCNFWESSFSSEEVFFNLWPKKVSESGDGNGASTKYLL